MLVRCDCCNGRRTIVGLGGMEKKCGNCHGVGHVKVVEPVAVVAETKVDRRSVTYKQSIKDIMDLRGCDKDEAVRIFDDEFTKLDA